MMKRLNSNSAMFLLSMAIGLACLAAVNVVGDPSGYWKAPDMAAWRDAGWAGALRLNSVSELRSAKRSMIAGRPRADAVIMGSSRAFSVSQACFGGGVSVLNLALPSGQLEDFAEQWQCLKDAEKTPALAVIFVDAWIFNQDSPQKAALNLRPGLGRAILGLKLSPFSAFAWLGAWCRDETVAAFESLFSLESFQNSLKCLRQGSDPRPRDEGYFALPGRVGIRADGSYLEDVYLKADPDPSAMLARQEALIPSRDHGFERWTFAPGRAAFFRALVRDMGSHGVRVWLLNSPYHQAMLDHVRALPEGHADMEREMLALRAEGSAEKVVVERDFKKWGCTDDEFVDYHHARESCMKKLFKAISRP